MLFDEAVTSAKALGAVGYIVEMYPNPADGIFCYQFVTAQNRNIATYIPDVGSFVPQNGYDPHGRKYYDLEMRPEIENLEGAE